ncbi:MAG: hypothetical protein HY758_00395 [Nitrospirae bacterium]|nr:hypothetical protein [Nitrospirota bacterium]
MIIKKITVKNIEEIAGAVKPHGGGQLERQCLPPNEHRGSPCFICEAICKDGTLIEFYAADAEATDDIVSKLMPDEESHRKNMQKHS